MIAEAGVHCLACREAQRGVESMRFALTAGLGRRQIAPASSPLPVASAARPAGRSVLMAARSSLRGGLVHARRRPIRAEGPSVICLDVALSHREQNFCCFVLPTTDARPTSTICLPTQTPCASPRPNALTRLTTSASTRSGEKTLDGCPREGLDHPIKQICPNSKSMRMRRPFSARKDL